MIGRRPASRCLSHGEDLGGLYQGKGLPPLLWESWDLIFFTVESIRFEQGLSLQQSSPGSVLVDLFVIREQVLEGCFEKIETSSL